VLAAIAQNLRRLSCRHIRFPTQIFRPAGGRTQRRNKIRCLAIRTKLGESGASGRNGVREKASARCTPIAVRRLGRNARPFLGVCGSGRSWRLFAQGIMAERKEFAQLKKGPVLLRFQQAIFCTPSCSPHSAADNGEGWGSGRPGVGRGAPDPRGGARRPRP
jgi:hypothetical protein